MSDENLYKLEAALGKQLDAKLAAVIEHFDDKLVLIIENIYSRIAYHLEPIKKDVSGLKTDMKVIKAAITDTNHELRDIDRRVSHLETKA